ncbi:hypothetical protein ACQPZQ_37285 [Pseudonocardia sp. CA-142604]|uniref:hypothetical protein n=1 Tax=Pseudonocardia sp. CA-142604 TaxID=3240024 RepID=UPI003D943F85
MSPEMEELAADSLVHDYRDMKEFQDHATRKTDHIGNLPTDGTWVRFSPTLLNVVGEAHNATTLHDVVQAVRTRSFIYEGIPSDDLRSENPAMLEAIRTMSAGRLARFGLEAVEDIQPYGLEPIHPKIGYVFTALLPLLQSKKISKLGGYFGKVFQSHLKMSWAAAGHLHDEVERRRPQGRETRATGSLGGLSEAETEVAGTYARQKFAPKFISDLQPDDDLRHSLELWVQRQPDNKLDALLGELHDFVSCMLGLVREKYQRADLKRSERLAIWASGMNGEQEKFDHWRNVEIGKRVREAQQRGVRYAGMGGAHSDYLRHELGLRSFNFYDLHGENLKRDRKFTDDREEEMRSYQSENTPDNKQQLALKS